MNVFRSARLYLVALLLSLVPASSFAGVFISINIAPPVLPVYEQPLCPEEGWLWTPGYWAYGDAGYYWVPGAWVPAPQPGYLWTPPYWGWEGGNYIFHEGYWGEHVGFYGGVNYGFGYMGIGFAGGDWRGGHFFYNTAVMRVNTTIIHNTYVNETIVRQNTIVNDRHVAFAGGPGGIQHQPTPQERQFSSERHVPPTSVQTQHIQAAAHDPQQRFSANHGRPATVAAARPVTAPMHTAAAGNRPESGARSNTSAVRPGASAARPETRQATPAARTESRPAPAAHTESRPAPAARQEARPAPAARPESHPAPASHPETHSAPAPKAHPSEKPHGRGR